MSAPPYRPCHVQAGLRRFAVAITLLNVLGHGFFGFEQSYAQPLVAVATAYCTELLLEAVDARCQRRRPRFTGGPRSVVDFLLSAHISGLAVSMLLYANDRLWVVAFAAAAAIGSKAIFRAGVGGPGGAGTRHFFNPSNFGIALTLLLFPWVGVTMPYHFTEELTGAADWILPGVIVATGTFLNARFTRRLPLIAAWLCGFVLQAQLRAAWFGTPPAAGLVPMTGVAFVLYTFYMITDPATTPSSPRAQAAFGASVAAAYAVLMTLHVVFGLFFSLAIVCALRGLALHALARRRGKPQAGAPGAPGRSAALAAAGRPRSGSVPDLVGGKAE
jgi:enediyne biosynthesis protein E5